LPVAYQTLAGGGYPSWAAVLPMGWNYWSSPLSITDNGSSSVVDVHLGIRTEMNLRSALPLEP
jgi:hypothetical protein